MQTTIPERDNVETENKCYHNKVKKMITTLLINFIINEPNRKNSRPR